MASSPWPDAPDIYAVLSGIIILARGALFSGIFPEISEIRYYFNLGRHHRGLGDTCAHQSPQHPDEARRVVQPGHHAVLLNAQSDGLRAMLDVDLVQRFHVVRHE